MTDATLTPRAALEDAIERLLAILDRMDGGDDEPSLGGYGMNGDDRERDDSELGEPEDWV